MILKALKRLTWAGEYALTTNKELFKPFNELLTVGYFEHSHIGVSHPLSLILHLLTYAVP